MSDLGNTTTRMRTLIRAFGIDREIDFYDLQNEL